jgi:D-alanyl-D-alanine carboxypeptidase/D-alanyl-D-alanine-endopeptidase (penicillin-binding protein 4)
VRLLTRALALVVSAALLASACGQRTPPPVVSAPASPRLTELQRTIDRVLASPDLSRGTWGITVRSLTRGDTLYALNARKLLMPASAQKIVTLAVAADRLGWDFRFHTRLLVNGSIEDGVLNGDIVITGAGDPSIDDWDGMGTRLFQGWAAALKSAGIRRVLGRVIGDDNVFDDEGPGNGWAWDDLGTSYATGVGGLQFNQNAVRLFIGPGLSAGDPADIYTLPAHAPVTLLNHVTTVGADATASVTIRPVPSTPALDVRGSIRAGTPPFGQNVSVRNPTLYFANAVRDALTSSGIDIVGPAVDIDDLDPAPDPSRAKTIDDHESAPLIDIATTMMMMSQNLYAETLVKTIALQGGGVGSTAAGLSAIRTTLATWNAGDDLLIVDGSGLSRYNLASPDTLTAVLAHVYHDPALRDRFMDTLPAMGEAGTLAQRLQGTPAAGRVRAKTGSFSNARALAGFATTAAGEPLAFAIIANNYGVPPQAIDRAADAIVLALTQLTQR